MKMYKLLIADDEKNILDGLSRVIETYDLNIDIVFKATDGKMVIDNFTNDIDIVLIDINMPYLNGLECIQKIKELKKDVKIIIISSYDDFKYAQKAIEYRVDAYILKPIDEDHLYDLLCECIKNIDKKRPMTNTNTIKSLSRQIVRYIDDNFNDPKLSSLMIEDKFNISRSYLFRIMKNITDKSLNEYITMIRIYKAIEYLHQDDDISLKEIASNCGYTDALYFSRVFKKQTGHSPSEYRKMIKDDEA